jgi:hypothetical protein
MRTLILIGLAGVAAAGAVVSSQDDRRAEPPAIRVVTPHDDAAGDPGFQAFRARALKAAETCSRESLRDILSRVPGTGTMGDPASGAFWHYWTVEDEDGLKGLCRVLSRALQLGAVRWGDDIYCMPYVSCAGGTVHELPFGQYLTGVTDRVEIRSAPSANAELLAAAPYPPLIDCRIWPDSCGPRTTDRPPAGWLRVRLDAHVGYVSVSQIRDQHEPYLQIRRQAGGWRITRVASAD